MSGYLFYSKKCDTCINLRTIMNTQNMLKDFNEKNIDNMSIEEINKLGLQTVPTILIVYTYSNGESRQGLYEGENAFTWVENVVNTRRQNMMKYNEETRRLIQNNRVKKQVREGVLDYCDTENSGVSDGYAYFSEKIEIDKQLDLAQPKSFLPYGQDNNFRILSIPVSEEDKKRQGYKINDKDQKKMTADLEKMRNIQDEQIKQSMQSEQIDSIINGQNRKF